MNMTRFEEIEEAISCGKTQREACSGENERAAYRYKKKKNEKKEKEKAKIKLQKFIVEDFPLPEAIEDLDKTLVRLVRENIHDTKWHKIAMFVLKGHKKDVYGETGGVTFTPDDYKKIQLQILEG